MDNPSDDRNHDASFSPFDDTLYGGPSAFRLVCPVKGCKEYSDVIDIDEVVMCTTHSRRMIPEAG
jgi:hypothetical protein